jgi:hypothetical protein
LIDPSLPLTKSSLRVSLDPSHPISKAIVRHLPRSLFPILRTLLRHVPRLLHELRFRRVLKTKREAGRERYSELRLSLHAQAKLRAAYLRYEPPPFHGPVAILLSSLTRATRTEISVDLLPFQHVHVFEGNHQDISGSVAAARLLQATFDAAIIDQSALLVSA